QLGEDGRAIEVNRQYRRHCSGDTLDLFELGISILEAEIALMQHRAEHVVRMQRLEWRVGADDGDLRLGKIRNHRESVTPANSRINAVKEDSLAASNDRTNYVLVINHHQRAALRGGSIGMEL